MVGAPPPRAWSYWGLTPSRRGRRDLKARAFWFAELVVRGRDEYYYPLYQAKREYYASRPDLRGAPRAAIDGKAKFWLAKILVSHAWELIRRHRGLPVNPHRNYIRVKEKPGDRPDPEVLENIRGGRA